MPTPQIAILDFGSQYTHLIARRVRELGVHAVILPTDTQATDLASYKAVILSGGPRSVLSEIIAHDDALFDLPTPILGLCYGHQLMSLHYGGEVERGDAREYGLASLEVDMGSPIFADLPEASNIWMSHGDHVSKLPEGFVEIGKTSSNSGVTAMANVALERYGFQFHPEVTHSEHGMQMIRHFVFDIAHCEKDWSDQDMLAQIQNQIREEAGDKNVFLLVSGGVDSTICLALLEKTLGKERVFGFHVDHGFMRQDESAKVKTMLTQIGLDDLHVEDASKRFFAELDGVTEPEAKRKIIGDLFLDITNEKMDEKGCTDSEWLLGQGTIYPDVIESGGTDNADKIKTHHNRVDRVQEMIAAGRIIEPIKDLYKDEVREIGRMLGVPDELVDRHPFPGPGLAIRTLCSSEGGSGTKVIDTAEVSAVGLPVQSVGVQGDERTYAHPAVLLFEDGLTHADKALTATTFTNTHSKYNRGLELLAGDKNKLESDATLQAKTLTKSRTEILQTADQIVMDAIATESCSHIWQFPVVLIPFGHTTGESLVLRPVTSNEAMTVEASELPAKVKHDIIEKLSAMNAFDYIFLDLTAKPPGTIEWE